MIPGVWRFEGDGGCLDDVGAEVGELCCELGGLLAGAGD